jgi:Spy/CpxP family protein refolding chaperone
MRRVVPIVLAATLVAAAVAAAVVKSREEEPNPETPEGSWELDEHGTEA